MVGMTIQTLLIGAALAAPAAPLAAGEWTLVGPGTLTGTVTLDGRSGLQAAAGCNKWQGRYAARAGVFLTGPIAGTRMACDPAAMQNEAEVLSRLRGLTGYTLDGERLTLRGGAGNLELRRYAPALGLLSAPQPGTTYQASRVRLGGQDLPLVPPLRLTAQAAGGGRVQLSGTAGCNRLTLSAEAAPESGKWTLSPLAMTRMACPDMTAEGRAAEVLSGGAQMQARGGELHISSPRGELVLSPVGQ